MPVVRLLTEADLRRCIALDDDAIQCIENCFLTLATEDVRMPPIMRLDIEQYNGEVDVKTAYLPGFDSFAIKISPGFFDNPKLGLPSVSGLMVLFSARTGQLESILLDNGYLTDVRTAAAGAVAANWLARKDSTRAAILGAGVQAGLQLKALTLVRNISEASVWARDAAKTRAFAHAMSAQLGIAVTVAESPAAAADGADIIVTTTPSPTPLLQARDLRQGQHVTAMGSDAGHKNELDPRLLKKADIYACDRLAQTRLLGELHHAIAANVLPADTAFPELGEIISGELEGRTDEAQITVCDLTGTGAQDTAIANLAWQRTLSSDSGTRFDSGGQ